MDPMFYYKGINNRDKFQIINVLLAQTTMEDKLHQNKGKLMVENSSNNNMPIIQTPS